MKTKGILLTILSAVLFGFNPLLSKQIYALGGNSVTLSFFRMLITALAFWILNVIWLHEDFRVDGREFRKLFFCAQGYCLTPYLLWSSYNYLPSGLATTIHFVYPVLVLLGSIIFYHEGLTGKKAVSWHILCGRDHLSLPHGRFHQHDRIPDRIRIRSYLYVIYFTSGSLRSGEYPSI